MKAIIVVLLVMFATGCATTREGTNDLPRSKWDEWGYRYVEQDSVGLHRDSVKTDHGHRELIGVPLLLLSSAIAFDSFESIGEINKAIEATEQAGIASGQYDGVKGRRLLIGFTASATAFCTLLWLFMK